ncbi:hypothetical protein ACIPYQ_41155 [Streptomyces sp. NPDC090045]|uniref:hypothetical protein n=1 Tax=Streptomyces sp. NPDC090045 TaxID=3365927 RepID=UPI0037FFFF81
MLISVFSALATPTGDLLTVMVLAVPMTALIALSLAVIIWRDRAHTRQAAPVALSPGEGSSLDLAPSRIEVPVGSGAVTRRRPAKESTRRHR